MARAPFGQLSRRLLGSNLGIDQGGEMLTMPLGPRIMVSR